MTLNSGITLVYVSFMGSDRGRCQTVTYKRAKSSVVYFITQPLIAARTHNILVNYNGKITKNDTPILVQKVCVRQYNMTNFVNYVYLNLQLHI